MAQWNFGEVILAAIANQERMNVEKQAEADRAAQASREHDDRVADQKQRLDLYYKDKEDRRTERDAEHKWQVEEANRVRANQRQDKEELENMSNPLVEVSGFVQDYPDVARSLLSASADGKIRAQVAHDIVRDYIYREQAGAMYGKPGKKTAAELQQEEMERLVGADSNVIGWGAETAKPDLTQLDAAVKAPVRNGENPLAGLPPMAQGRQFVREWAPRDDVLKKNLGLLAPYIGRASLLPALLEQAMYGDPKRKGARMTDNAYGTSKDVVSTLRGIKAAFDKGLASKDAPTVGSAQGEKNLYDQLYNLIEKLERYNRVNDYMDALQYQQIQESKRAAAEGTRAGKEEN